jgi:hypothetical protein
MKVWLRFIAQNTHAAASGTYWCTDVSQHVYLASNSALLSNNPLRFQSNVRKVSRIEEGHVQLSATREASRAFRPWHFFQEDSEPMNTLLARASVNSTASSAPTSEVYFKMFSIWSLYTLRRMMYWPMNNELQRIKKEEIVA